MALFIGQKVVFYRRFGTPKNLGVAPPSLWTKRQFVVNIALFSKIHANLIRHSGRTCVGPKNVS